MTKKCYINGIGCVSAQKTYDGTFLNEIVDHGQEIVVNAVKPEYHKYISPAGLIHRIRKKCMIVTLVPKFKQANTKFTAKDTYINKK